MHPPRYLPAATFGDHSSLKVLGGVENDGGRRQIGEERGEKPELPRVAWPHFSGFHEKVGEIELAKEVAQGASLRKELRKRKRWLGLKPGHEGKRL